LDRKQRGNAVVQQFSLPFFALVDAGQAAWVHLVQWPLERDRMLRASCDRRREIERASSGAGAAFGSTPIGDSTVFSGTVQARDADFLLRSLREQGVESVVVLMPFGNPDLLQKTWSAAALANRDRVVELMKAWLDRRNVAYVDFNSPAELAHFPDRSWDDPVHLKDPGAFAYMSERIAPVLQSRISRSAFRSEMSERGIPQKLHGRVGSR
jgi:hypothetical protein